MLSKVFVFVSGIITGFLTTIMLVGASMITFPERWQKLAAVDIPDEE